mmetsp:Transcript_4547/g.16860  ORF Transcript_4547/g.16860 Transcript_4547/m.16860 type:complete len:206 (+) Transcript_4547:370-987(+)
MSARESSVGLGNSILRSILPGRNKAGSRISSLFVAMMTLIWLLDSNPSSWLSSSSIVRWTSESPPPLPRALPIESTSSMKRIAGAFSRAITNNSRTIFAPSPMYFCTSSLPETRIKQHSVWCATALASSVLPVPGGPYKITPFGCAIPRLSKSSGCLIGSSTTSLISLTCWSSPPIMSKVLSGTFSTFIKETSGSTRLGRTRCRA